MAYAIDWHTAHVHLTERATLVLTVKVLADPLLVVGGEPEPNPLWRQSFAHMAAARRREWQRRHLHWGVPKVAPDGTITVDPIDGDTVEAGFLRGELDDMVKRSNERNDDWVWLEGEAQQLTDFFRSGHL